MVASCLGTAGDLLIFLDEHATWKTAGSSKVENFIAFDSVLLSGFNTLEALENTKASTVCKAKPKTALETPSQYNLLRRAGLDSLRRR